MTAPTTLPRVFDTQAPPDVTEVVTRHGAHYVFHARLHCTNGHGRPYVALNRWVPKSGPDKSGYLPHYGWMTLLASAAPLTEVRS